MGAPGAGGCGGLVVGVALVGESAADGLEATEIVEPETAAVGEGGASGRWPGHEAPFTDATCDGSLMHTAQWALE